MSDMLFYQSQNKTLTMRYADIVYGSAEEDTRTAEEIVGDIIQKAGLEVINK